MPNEIGKIVIFFIRNMDRGQILSICDILWENHGIASHVYDIEEVICGEEKNFEKTINLFRKKDTVIACANLYPKHNCSENPYCMIKKYPELPLIVLKRNETVINLFNESIIEIINAFKN